ncbi:MAG: hypothetical protein ACJAYG_001103 [Oceanicoccus sp.]|jgi:hypothetical protein
MVNHNNNELVLKFMANLKVLKYIFLSIFLTLLIFESIASGIYTPEAAYKTKQSNVQVQSTGVVVKILADDNTGSRHQKFILKLARGHMVLIAHNIDLAPRIVSIKKGDSVEFHGEYEWNSQGGVVHWTHNDPYRKHTGGWLRHNGRLYE